MSHKNQQFIETRARQLWERAGRPEGRDLEFWLAAERQALEPGTSACVSAADEASSKRVVVPTRALGRTYPTKGISHPVPTSGPQPRSLKRSALKSRQ